MKLLQHIVQRSKGYFAPFFLFFLYIIKDSLSAAKAALNSLFFLTDSRYQAYHGKKKVVKLCEFML